MCIRDRAFYEAQYKKYRDFCEMLHSRGVDIPIRHCSNSAGIVEGLDSNGLDMVCLLYTSGAHRCILLPV